MPAVMVMRAPDIAHLAISELLPVARTNSCSDGTGSQGATSRDWVHIRIRASLLNNDPLGPTHLLDQFDVLPFTNGFDMRQISDGFDMRQNSDGFDMRQNSDGFDMRQNSDGIWLIEYCLFICLFSSYITRHLRVQQLRCAASSNKKSENEKSKRATVKRQLKIDIHVADFLHVFFSD